LAAYSWYRRPGAWKLAIAGFLGGYAVSIRYTEGLLVLPLGYLVLLRWRESRASGASQKEVVLHSMAAAAAGIVALIPLLMFHAHAFGSIWRTGYSFTGQSHAFGLVFFLRNFPFALWTLCSIPTGLFIFFPAGLAALVFRRWIPRKCAGFLALAAIPTLLLYGSYYWANRVEPVMYVRFFVTIFPLLLISSLMPAEVLTRSRPLLRYALVGALLVFASTVLGMAPDQNRIAGTAYSDLAATRLIQKHLPPDAVVVGNGYMNYSFVYYTDMTVIYPVYFSEDWVDKRLRSEQGQAGVTVDFNPLRMQRFREQFGGRTQEELYAMLERKLLGDARDGRTVALIATRTDPQWFAYLRKSFDAVIIAQDEENDLILVQLKPR
jgi:hypothetical protein